MDYGLAEKTRAKCFCGLSCLRIFRTATAFGGSKATALCGDGAAVDAIARVDADFFRAIGADLPFINVCGAHMNPPLAHGFRYIGHNFNMIGLIVSASIAAGVGAREFVEGIFIIGLWIFFIADEK